MEPDCRVCGELSGDVAVPGAMLVAEEHAPASCRRSRAGATRGSGTCSWSRAATSPAAPA